MDRRAKLQLRLQQTVEGLSVAAIAYYMVGLAVYLLKPLTTVWPGLKSEWITAALVPVSSFLDRTVTARVAEDVVVPVFDLDGEVVTRVDMVSEVDAPVVAGQRLGTLTVVQGDRLLAQVPIVAESDVVITTAAVFGKKAPLLITADMVRKMQPGSVIVDLAAEFGGNCELTQDNRTVVDGGVTIIGAANLPSQVPYHASQMYANNLVKFLQHLMGKDKQFRIDTADEITRETLVCREGQIVHAGVRAAMGLPADAGPEGSGA